MVNIIALNCLWCIILTNNFITFSYGAILYLNKKITIFNAFSSFCKYIFSPLPCMATFILDPSNIFQYLKKFCCRKVICYNWNIKSIIIYRLIDKTLYIYDFCLLIYFYMLVLASSPSQTFANSWPFQVVFNYFFVVVHVSFNDSDFCDYPSNEQ